MKAFARQAISTKFLGATNHRGSRIRVTAEAGSLTVEWAHELDVFENHARAARLFADKMGWKGEWFGGATRDGYVFVTTDGGVAFGGKDGVW